MRRFLLILPLLLLFCCRVDASTINFGGFESGASTGISGWDGPVSNTASFQTTTKHTGSYALKVNPTTTGVGYGLILGLPANGCQPAINAGASVATSYVSFYLNLETLPSSLSEQIFDVENTASAYKCSVRLTSAGNLAFYDTTPTLQATGTTVLSTGTWYLIDVKCGTSASTAAWEVRINGVSEISGSSANTTATNAGEINLGKRTDRNGKGITVYYDDWSWSDSAYPGAQQTTVLVPNGAGNALQWVAGVGTADYTSVAELPNDGNTTYLKSDLTSGHAFSVAMTNTSTAGITGTVNSVKVDVIVARDGGTNGAVNVRLRSNTTNSDTSTSGTTTSSYNERGKISDTDPATSSAWTLSGVDGTEAGVLEASTTQVSRVTAMYEMVNYVPAVGGTTGSTGTLTGVGLLPYELLHCTDRKHDWSLN
jgi:hypothetical protein